LPYRIFGHYITIQQLYQLQGIFAKVVFFDKFSKKALLSKVKTEKTLF
jgi:hypothetical protein